MSIVWQTGVDNRVLLWRIVRALEETFVGKDEFLGLLSGSGQQSELTAEVKEALFGSDASGEHSIRGPTDHRDSEEADNGTA